MPLHLRPSLRAVLILLAVCLALAAYAGRVSSSSDSGPTAAAIKTAHIIVDVHDGASPSRARRVALWLEYIHARAGADFGRYPRTLRVDLYGRHRSFARALWRIRHQRPQSSTDNAGSIVAGSLLLGPISDPYARHGLTHIYTEWLLDSLSGNVSDALPASPWLYDGLAEVEAYRYAPDGLPCSKIAQTAFGVAYIGTARRWLQIRAGPLSSLEYCTAFREAQAAIRDIGWRCMLRLLHRHDVWTRIAPMLAGSGRHVSCS